MRLVSFSINRHPVAPRWKPDIGSWNASGNSTRRRATPENETRLLEIAREATGGQWGRPSRGYRNAVTAGGEPASEERCVRQRIYGCSLI